MFEKRLGGAGRGMVDADAAGAFGPLRGHGEAGAELDRAGSVDERRRRRPAAGAVPSRDILERGAAEAAAGRQEGDGFEEVGLARRRSGR
jgi:hypothetical protein